MFLLATDIDETVHDGAGAAAEFLAFWDEISGHEPRPLLVYNTGRSLADAQELIESTALPEAEYIISSVGTDIYDVAAGNLLNQWSAILSPGWDIHHIWKTVSTEVPGIELQPAIHQTQFKSSWYWEDRSPDQIQQLADMLHSKGLSSQLIYSSNLNLDILPEGANKGNALQWLRQRLDIQPHKTVVAGNSGNDLSALSLDQAFSIVVANADPDLLETAAAHGFYLSQKPCTSGVIDGIEHFISRLEDKG